MVKSCPVDITTATVVRCLLVDVRDQKGGEVGVEPGAQLSVLVGPDRLERLRQMANRAGTSVAEIVRCLIDHYAGRAIEALLEERVKRLEEITEEMKDDASS